MQPGEPALGGQHHRKREPAAEQEHNGKRSSEQGGVGRVGEDGLGAEPKTCGREELGVAAPDPAAQTKSVSTTDLQELKIVLSSVVADQKNTGKVAFSYSNKGTGRAANSVYAAPAGESEPNSSVIVAEITYAFTPLVNLTSVISPGAFEMQRTFYARPRESLTVAKTN